ncbi:Collagen alpha-2(I) chain [Orchesella cincta]|uniref:Collagen alpha-2(I) chain n=1 Tax=Orchesella cincta TaxID=48709 RepID=A0A1D2MQD6_ORCCI|nr:Collagen alpha-2(I) chain [Orchesella cincta]
MNNMSQTISSHLPLLLITSSTNFSSFTSPPKSITMQAVAIAVLAFAAVCSAGGITGYSTGNYVQHAHAVSAVAAPVAAPVAYAQQAIAAPVAYAAAPVVQKTIAPVAQSTAFVNRAPAARLAGVAHSVAAPVAAYGAVGPVGVAGAYGYSGIAGVGAYGYNGYNGLAGVGAPLLDQQINYYDRKQNITVTVLALVAAVSAGGLVGYSTGNYVQHAHAVHAAPVAVAQPVVRAVGVAHAPIGIAHAGYAGYAGGLAGPGRVCWWNWQPRIWWSLPRRSWIQWSLWLRSWTPRV